MVAEISHYSDDFLKILLGKMILIRRFEEKAAQLYGLRKFGGFCHLYIGQEAIAAGAVAAVDLARDYIMTAYRDHGHALAVGMEPGTIMAELFAKATGCSKGKGGSMHLFDAGRHFLGGFGIVGGHIPLGTGVAFALKYRQEQAAVLCFFGEGTIHQGAFHESLNMARIWNLPIVYICENNQYGMGTDFRRVSAVQDLASLSRSYDMPGRQVDGMDALAVYEEVKGAADRARAEGMPALLEVRTYRYMGHSMSDPATYRTREEVDKYRQQDPILILKDKMIKAGRLRDEDLKNMDAEARRRVDEAVKFAEESPEPPLESRFEDVLA